MDSVKNWYRSKSMNFPPQNNGRSGGGYDFGNNPGDFKSQNYGPTDRALKMATEVGKKLTPSTETKNTVVNAVEHYGRKLIPNEATKQKVSRFYESQVAKLKYAQLKEGYQPGDRDDLTRFAEEDSFYGAHNSSNNSDPFRYPATSTAYSEREVPTIQPLQPQSRLRTSSLSTPAPSTSNSGTSPALAATAWDGTFMRYKEPSTGRV
ncbi:hypothetical protein BV898_07773 [Hypsibius exemplaris]|uniref:Uncharacterized protein n=1 Tax=Hypsibius exemplaris TaxID=2072580 RepID=A0A1W0WSQ6_HYPEX|nr:hypothetical protein BV898_07773 [Hypsibius exemplaris]